jgi:hypothetical protein
MINDAKAARPSPGRKRANLGWAIQGVCLLAFAAGFLAERAGWIRCESSGIYAALLAVTGAAWIMEGTIDRRPSRAKEAEDAAPTCGPAAQPGKSGVAERRPSVSSLGDVGKDRC